MKVNVLTAIVLGVFASALMAQDADEGRRPRRGGGPGRFLEILPETLELDEAQRAQFDEIAASFRERFRTVRDLGRQLRLAQRDGDSVRAAELQRQLTETAFNPRESVKQTFDQIETILNDDQVSRFSEFRQETEQRWGRRAERRGPGGPDRRGGPGGRGMGRMLDRFAESLDLSEEQQAEFDEIVAGHNERMRESRPLMRDMRRAQRDGDMKKAEELRTQMFELGVDPFESLQQSLDEVEPILSDEQFERFSEMRMNFQERRGRQDSFRRWATELPDVVKMTDEQRQQFRELLRPGGGGQWRQMVDRMQEIRGKMREAREAGDDQRAAELQAELEALRPNRANRQEELTERVRGILNEDQLPLFEAYIAVTSGSGDDSPDDVRSLVRAAARSGLDRAQRKEWRTIMRDAMKSLRRIDRKDEEARMKLGADTRKKIEAMLREDQVGRFEKELESLKSGRKGKSGRKNKP